MKRIFLAGILGALLLVGAHTVWAGMLMDVRAVLGGEVSWTIEAGTAVTEGSELVRIRTLTGDAVAARSPAAGTVRELTTAPGDQIASGTVVARLAKN